ncbi:MAG TPA: hypothetical protein VFY81_09770 [Gammaproteobacteria bacterium]|nr:hypothetical protein [Gammaproteobacteria bacterium]
MPTEACARSIILPGTLVEIAGVGVLLSGESGVGKSDAVLGLLDRGHRLIADDAVELYLGSGRLYGRCPEPLQGLVAIRGLGILDVRQIFGQECLRSDQPVDLEIALELRQPPVDALMVERDIRSIMDVAVPRLRLPIFGGRDLPLLLEVAARAHQRPATGRSSRGGQQPRPSFEQGGKEGT